MILLVPLRRQRSRTPAYLRGPGEVRDCCPTPAREDQVGSGGAGVRATGDARAAISYPRGPRTNLVIEAGYRCAICKETSGLTIDHIVEWAKVRKHEFTNMIVLCAVCHARKTNTSDPRHINRAGLDRYKSKLMMLNSRYSDLERRVIEEFQEKLATDPLALPSIFIPERLNLLVKYLIPDGLARSVAIEIKRDPNPPPLPPWPPLPLIGQKADEAFGLSIQRTSFALNCLAISVC